jgi:hypothetical protein
MTAAPEIDLEVIVRETEARSAQFQFEITIRNKSQTTIDVHEINVRSPSGSETQNVYDSAYTGKIAEYRRLCEATSILLSDVYRQRALQNEALTAPLQDSRGFFRRYFDNRRRRLIQNVAFDLRVNNSREATALYDNFIYDVAPQSSGVAQVQITVPQGAATQGPPNMDPSLRAMLNVIKNRIDEIAKMEQLYERLA